MTELMGANEGLVAGSAIAPNVEKQPCVRAFSLLSHCTQPEGCDRACSEDSTEMHMK